MQTIGESKFLNIPQNNVIRLRTPRIKSCHAGNPFERIQKMLNNHQIIPIANATKSSPVKCAE